MKLFWIAVVIVIISGCNFTKGKNEIQPTVNLPSPLSKTNAVVIQIPKNGKYKNKTYEGSGEQTAEVFREVFSGFAENVSFAVCSGSECERGSGYFVTLNILHWEDRATGWTGRRDRVAIKATIYDASSKSRITSNILQASGSNAALSGHVEDLLHSVVSDYLTLLY
jgi:hypothetical protein